MDPRASPCQKVTVRKIDGRAYPEGSINHDNFVKRIFRRDLKEWGGKKIRFYDLRHTATTLMIASGIDLKTVQEICGHGDIKTTMNYVHLLSNSIRETARKFSVLPGGPFVDHRQQDTYYFEVCFFRPAISCSMLLKRSKTS